MSANIEDFVATLTQALSEIFWEWNTDFWRQTVGLLKLQEIETVQDRVTYSFGEDREISAYFSQENLSFLEIPILVFFNSEFLSLDEYEKKLEEFNEQYDQSVSSVSSILGTPEFNGNPEDSLLADEVDAIKLGIWSIKNAKLMVNLNHQGQDLPIALSVYVEPIN